MPYRKKSVLPRFRRPRDSQDIVAKHVTEACSGELLQLLGIPALTVVRALPTELPRVSIRHQFSDIVLETTEASLVHLEFQSRAESNLYRFAEYDLALARKFGRAVRTIVIFTRPGRLPSTTMDLGGLQYRIEALPLHRLDGDAVLDEVAEHLATRAWTPGDRVRLAFAMHMGYRRRSTAEAFTNILKLAEKVPDPTEQNYVVALILGFSGGQLSSQQMMQLRETMKMTQLLEFIETRAARIAREEGRQEGREEGREDVAKKLLVIDMSVDQIAQVTGLSTSVIERLRRSP